MYIYKGIGIKPNHCDKPVRNRILVLYLETAQKSILGSGGE